MAIYMNRHFSDQLKQKYHHLTVGHQSHISAQLLVQFS
jgi:hypothetical protein